MIVLSVGIDTLKALGKCKAVDYTWAHGRSCIVLSFFFAINTVIGKQYCYCFSKELSPSEMLSSANLPPRKWSRKLDLTFFSGS